MFIKSLVALALGFATAVAMAAVDVNKADQAQLESIKGIGPALSTKILDARKSASFKDWSDFMTRVAGIGPGNANRLSGHGLTVNGSAFTGSGDKPARPAKAPKTETADAKPAAKKAADERK